MGLTYYIHIIHGPKKIHERNPLNICRSFIFFYIWAKKYQFHFEGKYFINKILKPAWTSIVEVGMITWHAVNKQKSLSKIEMQTKMEDYFRVACCHQGIFWHQLVFHPLLQLLMIPWIIHLSCDVVVPPLGFCLDKSRKQ